MYIVIPAALVALFWAYRDIQGQSEYSFFGTAETDPRRLSLDADVWVEQEQVDAFEFLAVDVRIRGQLQHALERDGRMVGVRLFADPAADPASKRPVTRAPEGCEP